MMDRLQVVAIVAFRAMWAVLRNRRLYLLFALPNAMFIAAAALTKATDLLPVLSLITSALAAGITVAFLPAVWGVFRRTGPLTTSEALSLGIFCSWFAAALTGLLTFVWRMEGQPFWLINNDAVGYIRFLGICGACLHLVSPNAISEQIPTRRWLFVGLIVATMLVIFFVISFVIAKEVTTDESPARHVLHVRWQTDDAAARVAVPRGL